MSSDHNAIEFSVNFNGTRNINHQQLIRNYKKSNWKKYRLLVEKNLPAQITTSIESTNEIEIMISKLSEAMKHAENLSVPLNQRNDYALQLNPDILNMIKLRNIFTRQWQRTRRKDHKTTANRLNKQIKKAINETRNMNWFAKLSQIKPNNRDLYQTTKLKEMTLFHRLKLIIKLCLLLKKKLMLWQISLKVHTKIHHLTFTNKKKAPGKDRIHNTLIKNLPTIAIKHLHSIILICLRKCHFPSQWKQAEVIAILKPKEKIPQHQPVIVRSAYSAL